MLLTSVVQLGFGSLRLRNKTMEMPIINLNEYGGNP